MDCWKTQFSGPDGSQASASQVFISSCDQPLDSGQVMSNSSSAKVYCGPPGSAENLEKENSSNEVSVYSLFPGMGQREGKKQ